jgi:hypothetical protein
MTLWMKSRVRSANIDLVNNLQFILIQIFMRAHRPRHLILIILNITQVLTILACLSVLTHAQTQNPTPSPSPPPSAGTGGESFSDYLRSVMSTAANLLPIIQNEVEGPLLPWVSSIAWGVAILITYFSFARIWRENAGAGVDLFWWFGRLAICITLMGSGPLIVTQLSDMGFRLAVGDDGVSVGGSVLNNFYLKQRTSFDNAYIKFSRGHFTVQSTPVQPVPGGVQGVLFSIESPMQGTTRKLDEISKSMPLLFDSLNLARGVISFGDFFLMMLSSILLIAMRLTAPVMIALAIDRNIAQKVTYQYVWGTIVLTLIWPIVALVIKSVAYLGGNIAMAVGDQPVYAFDAATMEIIKNGSQQPVYTIVIAVLIMLISGLCLWGSPYIAYQLSIGRVYEGVSTTVSSWVGQLVGAGIGYYSASMAAGIQRQADTLQAQGGFNAEVTRATTGQAAADLNARSAKLEKTIGQQGSLINQLAGIDAAKESSKYQATAEQNYNMASLDAQNKLEKANIDTRRDLASADFEAGRQRENTTIDADSWASERELYAAKTESVAHSLGNIASAAGPKGQAIGGAVKLGGEAVGGGLRYNAIQARADGRQDAIDLYTDQAINNQGVAADDFKLSQDNYRRSMEGATRERRQYLHDAVDRVAGISEAGARRGSDMIIGGYNQAYKMNIQANAMNARGAIKAATQVRDAAIEAARLRAVASVVSALGHNIARNIEQGLTLRY